MDKKSQSHIDKLFSELLTGREKRSQLRSLTTTLPGAVDFSSNSYLSLSTNLEVNRAYLDRLQHHFNDIKASKSLTNRLIGSGGSRLLDGNSTLAETLESDIAKFHDGEAGLLFNSAMDANVGLFSCVPQPGDVFVYDEFIHASVHDGMRLSRATQRFPFAHNQVYAKSRDMTKNGDFLDQSASGAGKEKKSLEEILQELQQDPISRDIQNVFVAVEGVYSMDGDTAPLRDIADCVEKFLPHGNGYIIVDEAHSVGLFGDHGRGLVCALGLSNRVWARVLGFGKALGCAGGIVICSDYTRAYLVNYARTFIYTTAMAFSSLASIETAYAFLMAGRIDSLINHVHSLTRHAHAVIIDTCRRCKAPPTLLRVNTTLPSSPIIPLFTSEPRNLARHCQSRGFVIRPIVAPTVPRDKERVRICLHAENTVEQINKLGDVIEEWLYIKKGGDEAVEDQLLQLVTVKTKL